MNHLLENIYHTNTKMEQTLPHDENYLCLYAVDISISVIGVGRGIFGFNLCTIQMVWSIDLAWSDSDNSSWVHSIVFSFYGWR